MSHTHDQNLEVPTQKILLDLSKQKKKKKKLFPRVADYFAVKFYFSNAFLNTVEPI